MTDSTTLQPEISQLSDCVFTDIYLGSEGALLQGAPSSNNTEPSEPAPLSTHPEIKALRKQCEEKSEKDGRDDFIITSEGFVNRDGQHLTFRVAKMESIAETLFVLRRIPSYVRDLEELGLNEKVVERLMTADLRGLVVISGAYGQGKTHTASGMVKSRLKKFGGIAVALEDPPEMPLHGKHGDGQCYQIWVDRNKGGFGEACRKTARYAPSIIFMGEIRDADGADEALNASINGRLVICTTHSDSVAMTVERLYSLSSKGDSENINARTLLSNGLTAVIHQELIKHGDGKMPKTKILWLGDGEASKGARNIIKLGKFEHIEGEVQAQANAMLHQRRVA